MYTNHTIYVTHLYLNKQNSTMKCRPKACNKCRKMASTHQDLSQAKYHGSRNNVFTEVNSVMLNEYRCDVSAALGLLTRS